MSLPNVITLVIKLFFFTFLLIGALHYDVKTLAPVASLPFLAMAFSATFGGCLIDKTVLRYLNTTNVSPVIE